MNSHANLLAFQLEAQSTSEDEQHPLGPPRFHNWAAGAAGALALTAVVCIAYFSAPAGAASRFSSGGRQRAENVPEEYVSLNGGLHLPDVACGSSPALNGHNLQELIASSKGALVIANPNMRCTVAVKAALDIKGVKYEEHDFSAPFTYTAGASDVWDWLHCNYPDDKEGTMIMHSYVFIDGGFIGQGFAAAEKINSGAYDVQLQANGPAKSCAEQYPSEASIFQHYTGDATNHVLLFGWLGCPCTGVAQSRFASSSICYEGRTWANPESMLMKYLQCKEQRPQDHSFVYFRKSGAFSYVGNGFQLDEKAMSKVTFDKLVTGSGVETTCQHANVKKNVYGTALEECRAQISDFSGSWMDDGTCSEVTGGIHEICIEQLPADFSEQTHQSPWSEARAGMRHCVCVGAWSLYMTDAAKHSQNAKQIMPHCKAIPETALTERYLNNWKDWNGFPASVIKGVGELVTRCLKQVDPAETHAVMLKCGLKNHFLTMGKKVPELTTAAELASLRAEFDQLQCPMAV